MDELAQFGVTRETLERRVATPDVVAALTFQVQRVRELEERSRPGVDLLHPSSRDCIEAARVLYCGIVDEVERQGYDVFKRRATVPLTRRLAVAGPALLRARRARRRFGAGAGPLVTPQH
jgi:phytoene synthase